MPLLLKVYGHADSLPEELEGVTRETGLITINDANPYMMAALPAGARQSAQDARNLVVFFDSFIFEEGDPLIHFYAEGMADYLERVVLYVGCWTDPSRTTRKFLAITP